jgi:hypothetical protein
MKPFEFTPELSNAFKKKADNIEGEINAVINGMYEELGAQLRLHVVKPFCEKFNLTFSSGMGGWSFHYKDGPYARKCWFVGEDRRVLPDKPEGPEGDEDRWWVDVTEETESLPIAALDKHFNPR